MLIGGDISGVQDFIYTLTSKNAAKTLRGRSFYLQLLGEALLRYVLRKLELPYTNVIYSGGGNFFLLAPLGAAERLPAIRQYITQTLLTHHGTALYLALGETAVSARGFKRGAFKEHWDKMHAKMGAAKQKRYTELDDELYARVFEPIAHGGNQDKTCAVCGDESDKAVLLGEEETSKEKICPLCKSFEELGMKLTQANFVALGFSMAQPTEKHDAVSALRGFGMQFKFPESHNQTIAFEDKVERAVVWALDDLKEFPVVRNVPTARMTRYTVNRIPEMPFDELQEKSEGIPRLGILRMDVDNLGDLFGKGFGAGEENLATLSRIAALSFQMGLFFEGWVKKLCAEKADLVYAVYAGGDDVFLIAPWDKVPKLAQDIVADLRAYTGNNPGVHLSAGMTFIHGKYPVYQAADDAKDALDQAKAVTGKNAFSVFNQAWKWDTFAEVSAKFERLKKLVSDPKKDGLGAPQAILQTIRQFALYE
ncbi:MAG: type III-A CRISPR-associated protein Cas10/Csm1, partial [Chloroflexota bacterium]|nr:type III-A CRISPR-associated protein Cas10/Csm1 [Chloroflexota bacterium]